MQAMRPYLAGLTICILMLTGLGEGSSADTLIMPRELVDFGRARGCEPIDNFYDRAGMIDPPYVYGWLPGDKEKSAVFWCKKTETDSKAYNLVFKTSDLKLIAGCPAVIEWQDPPAGLSIETRHRLLLSGFHYVTNRTRPGPPLAVANAKVLVSYYDGL